VQYAARPSSSAGLAPTSSLSRLGTGGCYRRRSASAAAHCSDPPGATRRSHLGGDDGDPCPGDRVSRLSVHGIVNGHEVGPDGTDLPCATSSGPQERRIVRVGMDGLDALRTVNAGFERRLPLVRRDDWERPTPCEEWDVRALVNHVVGANRRYVLLLKGASATEVDATRGADHLGDDPLASCLATAAELTDAFREEGALARTVHHPAAIAPVPNCSAYECLTWPRTFLGPGTRHRRRRHAGHRCGRVRVGSSSEVRGQSPVRRLRRAHR
jgi:hypothetical protein